MRGGKHPLPPARLKVLAYLGLLRVDDWLAAQAYHAEYTCPPLGFGYRTCFCQRDIDGARLCLFNEISPLASLAKTMIETYSKWPLDKYGTDQSQPAA